MKAWCLFEQSGTFKNEFKKLGIDAMDVDIANEYAQTDIQTNLFIKENLENVATQINPGDVVMMFFPCIKFCRYATWRIQGITGDQKGKPFYKKLIESATNEMERSKYYHRLVYITLTLIDRGATIILENPYSAQSYLIQTLPMRPTIIIADRTEWEDAMKKPTAFWWLNGKPSNNFYLEPKTQIQRKRLDELTSGSKERSEMTPEFARRFIKTFILEDIKNED